MKSLIGHEKVNPRSNQNGFTFLDLLVAASVGLITISILADLVARSSKTHAQLDKSSDLNQIAFELEAILADSTVCTQNLVKTFDKQSYFYDPGARPELSTEGRKITIASIDTAKSSTNSFGDTVVISTNEVKPGTRFGQTRIKDIKVKHLSGLNSNPSFLNSVAQVELSFHDTSATKVFPIRVETTPDKKLYRCFSYINGQMDSGMGDSLCATLSGGTDWYGPYSGWVYDSVRNFCVKKYDMRRILVQGTQERADCPVDTIRAEGAWPIVTTNPCGISVSCTVIRPYEGNDLPAAGNPFIYWLQDKNGLKGETCDWLPGSVGVCQVYCYVPL